MEQTAVTVPLIRLTTPSSLRTLWSLLHSAPVIAHSNDVVQKKWERAEAFRRLHCRRFQRA